MSALIAAASIWGDLDDEDHGGYVSIVQDGVRWVSDALSRGVMIRADVLHMTEAEESGTERWSRPRVAAWMALGLRSTPSECVFWRGYLDPIYAAGLRIWPLDQSLVALEHHHKPGGPPHAILYGEDIVGYICPKLIEPNDDNPRLSDYEAARKAGTR